MQVDRNGIPVLVDDETGEVLAEAYWKTPYNHDRDQESRRTGLHCKDPSLTRQEFKDETDINVILERYTKNGIPADAIALPEHFGVWSGMDHFTARQRLAETNATFYLLDPKIRAEYQNDPAQWAEAVVTELAQGNRDKLTRMGIAFKEAPQDLQEPKAGEGGTPAPKPAEAPKTPPAGAKD